MKNFSVSNDIVPIGEFKAGVSKYLKDINTIRNSLIITQNGKPTGVLISPKEYDNLVATKLFINSISRGLKDIENGDVYTTAQLKNELKKARISRNK